MEPENSNFTYLQAPQAFDYSQYVRQPIKLDSNTIHSKKIKQNITIIVNSSKNHLLPIGLLLQFVGHGLELLGTLGPSLNIKLENQLFKTLLSGNLILAHFLIMLGLLILACFQIYLPESGRLSRGFRAGSKLFMSAIQVGLVAVALQLMQFSVTNQMSNQRWWLKYIETTTEWSLNNVAVFLHSISLILYGMSLRYLESCTIKPDVSLSFTPAVFMNTMGSLMNLLTAIFELLSLFTMLGNLYLVFHLLSILCTFFWSLSFKNSLKHMQVQDILES